MLTEVAVAPVRAAFVLEGLAFGGCPVNAVNLAVALRRRGHEIRLVAIDEDVQVSVRPLVRAAGLELETLPREAGLLERSRQLRQFLDRHDLPIVHVFAPWLGRPAALAAGTRRDRAAVVLNWNMHNEFPTTPRTPLVVGTGGLRDEAERRLGARVWLLEPPVDLETDRPDPVAAAAFRLDHGIGAHEPLLTLVGRVDRVMKLPGILRALDAVVHLDDLGVRLAVVGDGNAMGEVRERAVQVNALLGREAVVLTGSTDDPHPAYAAADVGLAMGGSALRALAHATPVVVLGEGEFSLVFAPDTLEHFERVGFYGHREPGGQPDPLVDQVRDLLNSPDRASLGSFGRDEVMRRRGMEAAADQLEEIYREALRVRPPVLTNAWDIAYLFTRDTLGRLRSRTTRRTRSTH